MSATQSSLLNLLDLAHEGSSEKRRELLRQVTDLFLDAPTTHSDAENEHFGQIMGQIAHEVEMSIRRDLAEKLAEIPSAPRGLLAQLANDEIEVARPVLQKAALKDPELIQVAKVKGQEHLAVIATRKSVSAAVTDVLVERADDRVLERLVRNKGASFSRGAMETVVARAESNERLHAPVLERQDLPTDLMHEMFFSVSSQLKEFILKRTSEIDPAELDAALAEAERRAAVRMKGQPVAANKAEQYINEREAARELNEALLITLLRAKKLPEFVAGFARLSGIDSRTVVHLMRDPGCEGLAIAARAARFDRETFSKIVLLADPKTMRMPSEVKKIMGIYDRLTIETAQRVMRFWKVRRQALKDESAPN